MTRRSTKSRGVSGSKKVLAGNERIQYTEVRIYAHNHSFCGPFGFTSRYLLVGFVISALSRQKLIW
jgi:hypothetical protein